MAPGDDALNEVSPLEVEALREKLAGLQHPVNVSSSPPEMPSSVVSSEGGLMLVTARPSGVRDMVILDLCFNARKASMFSCVVS